MDISTLSTKKLRELAANLELYASLRLSINAAINGNPEPQKLEASTTVDSSQPQPVLVNHGSLKPRRTMSDEGRSKMAASARRRWKIARKLGKNHL
jgi:hypothetical protein